MNRQKAINSQGPQTYTNGVRGVEAKNQVKIFNGKPQFRIRKRNESAKWKAQKYPIRGRTNNSFKEVQQSRSDAIENESDINTEPYRNGSMIRNNKKVEELGNCNVINKIQAKYGIAPSLPPGSKSK